MFLPGTIVNILNIRQLTSRKKNYVTPVYYSRYFFMGDVPSVGLYSTGFWRFFGFFSKMNMERSMVHRMGQGRENQALCVGQVSIELI